jgi:hypothetical protein
MTPGADQVSTETMHLLRIMQKEMSRSKVQERPGLTHRLHLQNT